jgi:hypothetical protein
MKCPTRRTALVILAAPVSLSLACAGDSGGEATPCQRYAADYARSCSGRPSQGAVQSCEHETDIYLASGCGDAWQGYPDCGTTSELTCSEGYVSCDAERQAHFQCAEDFSDRTGCDLGSRDPQCPNERPYLLGCRGEPPAERCAPLDMPGLFCCSG